MKKILLPTDLSANTPPLMVSACRLANQHEAKVILLHTYKVSLDFRSLQVRLIAKNWELQRMAKEEILQNFIREIPAELKQHVEFEIRLVKGNTVREIIDTAKRESPSTILMATGAYGLPNNRVRQVMKKAPCPVLAIPSGISLAQKAELIYVTHLNQEGKRIMEKLIKLSKDFSLKLRCLYVPTDTSQQEVLSQFKQVCKNELKQEILKIIPISQSKLNHHLNELGGNPKSKLWVVPIRNQYWWQWRKKATNILDYMPARSAVYALK